MPATLNYRQIGDVTVVDVAGRIDMGGGSKSLNMVITQLIREGRRKIILNLKETEYIDSSGFGELVSTLTRISNHEGELRLLGLTKQVRELL